MRWIPRPSICACRCFRGRVSARRKAAVKLHTLLDLRGNIPSFIHISRRQTARRDHVLDQLLLEAGAFYVMDRGYVDFARLYAIHQAAGVLRDPRQVEPAASPTATPTPVDRATGTALRSNHRL